MYRNSVVCAAASAVVLAGLAQPVGAADRFSLGRAVPQGVYYYAHGAHNPERDAINARWDEIGQAVVDARFQDDVRDTIRGLLTNEEERADFDAFWEKVSELIDGIEWRGLASEEIVYFARLSGKIPEHVIMLRGDPGAADKNITGLRTMLEELVKVSEGNLTLEVAEDNGNGFWRLTGEGMPFQVQLARRGDVIAVGLAQELLRESLGLLGGGSNGQPLVDTQRFKSALASLPAAEDTILFFDIAQLFDSLRAMLEVAEQEAGDSDDTELIVGIVSKILDQLDVVDFIVSVGQTDGNRVLTHEVARLKPGGADRGIGKVVRDQKPITRFDQYVPQEATDFSVSNGIDLEVLYDLVLDFIRQNVPDGEVALQDWARVQEEIGFNLQEDLLSWLTLEYVSVTLPAATPSAFSQEDSVFLLRVRDPAKARTRIDGWINNLQALLTENNQALMISDVQVDGAEGFKSVTHPMVMMFIRLVYGVHEDRLIISNSAQAIATCLATARGEHPSVAQNPRVQQEGLLPKGPACSVSFTDQSWLGQEIAGALGMVSFAMNMFGAVMASEDPEAGVLLGGIGKVIGKLSPIVARINFLSSTASATTFDGQAYHTKGVTTYRLEESESE